MKTYDVHFNTSDVSANKGFNISMTDCLKWIKNESGYLNDYAGGTVSIVRSDDVTVWERPIPKIIPASLIGEIQATHGIYQRIALCERNGYKVEVRPMGTGGVFQCKRVRGGEIRYQISAGWGRYNYAYCVIL